MVEIIVELSDRLATAFQEAVTYDNKKNETTYTPKERLTELARIFTKDTLHAARIKVADDAAAKELEDL